VAIIKFNAKSRVTSLKKGLIQEETDIVSYNIVTTEYKTAGKAAGKAECKTAGNIGML